MGHDFSAHRINYGSYQPLSEHNIDQNPFKQFKHWMADALDSKDIREAYAMYLATADTQCRPSIRTLLLREYSTEGFVFYTNYESRKGLEITANPRVALLFYWEPLERQVRIEGEIVKLEEEKSENYFNSRPEESQYSAMISPQSRVIESRSWLVKQLDLAMQQKAKRPGHWGGYLVKPDYFEFWQGGAHRLHDRIAYHREEADWHINRLAP